MGENKKKLNKGEGWLRRGLKSIYKEACSEEPTEKEIENISGIANGCIRGISISRLAESAGHDFRYIIEARISSNSIEWRMKKQETGPPPSPPFGHSLTATWHLIQKAYIFIRVYLYQVLIDMQIQRAIVHYPTLKTILAIEQVVKKANIPVSRNKILARLPTGVMRSTLNLALDYMEKRGMVLETKKGFIWTFNPSKKLEKAEKEGLQL